MPKSKTVYVCSHCGYISAKWSGQCPSCHQWNCMEETVQEAENPAARAHAQYQTSHLKGKLNKLKEVPVDQGSRLVTGIGELDRVLGGGIVRDSVTILAAKPGAGKSTLLLQVAQKESDRGLTVLYVTGEESESQVRRRAQRIIDRIPDNLWVYSTSHMNEVLTVIDKLDPQLIILDSIQTFYLDEYPSRPGSPTQIVECTNAILRGAKEPEHPKAVLMAGQLTKEDELAGVRSLEHMVDTVLFMEADTQEEIRTLSATKNRFGSIGEMGFFTMGEKGLEEITNPSRYFMTDRADDSDVFGSALAVIKQGTRPMIVEVESLISKSYTPYPSRISECLSRDQMGTLLSILEQRGGLSLYDKNVVIKSTGNLRLNQPSVSLGVLMSLASSVLQKGIDSRSVFIGDVGLTGELKKVPSIEIMVKETARIGFEKIYVPAGAVRRQIVPGNSSARIIEVSTLTQALGSVFGDYRRNLF